ncbi:MAG: B12-binding domain-containing radical SAM protein [Candidatus Omnitrophota bacterium]
MEPGMKALLMLPSFLGNKFGNEWRKNPTVTPPLGLLYVAGALERSGFEVRVLDLNVEKIEWEAFETLVNNSDVVGLSILTHVREAARELIREMREIKPWVKIICGGPYINSTLKPFPGADLTFVGEGDETAGEVCRHLVRSDMERLRGFRGLMFYEHGELVRTGSPEVLKDLNRFSVPARHLIDASRYGELVGIRLSSRITAIASSRGCRSACGFCNRRGIFRYRYRETRNVVDEIEHIADAGYDLLVFNEDNFAVNPQRGIDIMREIKRRGIGIRIMLQLRVDSISDESITAFKEAGVWCLIFGIESGTQEILDYYTKETTVEQGRAAVQAADRFGIFTFGFFILGAPSERDRHFRENLKFMTSIPLDFVGFNILDYEFGARIWAEKAREGVIAPTQIIVPTGPLFGALSYSDLQRYLRWSYRKFYLRPRHYLRLWIKCLKNRDFTLFLFMMKLSMKLFQRFRPFALADALPVGTAMEDRP